MMYKNKMAIAVKSNDKILREFDDVVYIPFGSTYSLILKNLNSVRVQAKVEIDGVDVGDGRAFVIDANGTLDLQRFISNGNMDHGNQFKFVERSNAIENHRGIKVDDGLIRVEFQFEREWHLSGSIGQYDISNNFRGIVPKGATSSEHYTMSTSASTTILTNNVGITVPGAVVEQKFKPTMFIAEEQKYVMVLKLLGQVEDRVVQQPVTVRTKLQCDVCGTANKATSKFCSQCGAGLQVV